MGHRDREENEAETTDEDSYVSRSQLKREAAEVADLGRRLTALTPDRLESLDLDDELHEAIEAIRPLRRVAYNRQQKWVSKLLRVRDSAEIEAALRQEPGATAAMRWRDRIVSEGDDALQAFLDQHPAGDRPQLRQLARAARQDPESPRGKRGQRDLLRAIEAARRAGRKGDD